MNDVSDDGISKIDTINIENHLWSFAQNQYLLTAAADELKACLGDLMIESSITAHAIQSRSKGLDSYRQKSVIKGADGERKYTNPAEQITDTVAARIIVFTKRDWARVVDLLEARFECRENKNPGDKKRNGYDSQHLIITKFKDGANSSRFKNLKQHFEKFNGIELQVRTVAGHAWAEYEHDVRYKPERLVGLSDNDRRYIDQLFIEAGGLRKYMDQIFDQIDSIVGPVVDESGELREQPEGLNIEGEVGDERVTPISEVELREFAIGRFSGMDEGDSESVSELAEQLGGLGIGTISQLGDLLSVVDSETVARLMDYPREVSAVRRLEDDVLFAVSGDDDRGEAYISLSPTEGRRYILTLRQRRVRNRFKIYTLLGVAGVEDSYTAAGMVRALVRLTLDQGVDIDRIEKLPFVARIKSDVRAPSLAKSVEIQGVEVFVSGAMGRDEAEEVMKHLLPLLEGLRMEIHRAGDPLFSSVGRIE